MSEIVSCLLVRISIIFESYHIHMLVYIISLFIVDDGGKFMIIWEKIASRKSEQTLSQ